MLSISLNMLYFAYGSNMNPNQMHARIGDFGSCRLIGSAQLSGHKLVFNVPDDHATNAAYANIAKNPISTVHGVLYDLDEKAFSVLDQYEHVPILYTRCIITVIFDGQEKEAYVYLGNKISTKCVGPTKRYLNRILLGKEFLPKEYFEKLSKIKTCPDPKFDSIKE